MTESESARKFQLAMLKKEEYEIQQELAVLERERDRHAMELKIVKYKEQARYGVLIIDKYCPSPN
ncbi:MAG: hypothetical protein MUE72_08840 [Chitinophagaceae bacterium]|jgi:hypothetical protein|nr:hypothetical protein [Chitinophagaceae bacterium]